jgi:predicted SAM-dependent methyltransferase
MLPYLNLGCGNKFHPEWTNIDFVSTGKGVIAHNLLNGIPMPDNSFDAVYHSHVLEHFPKEKALPFIKECHRVLRMDGVIRVAIPDLEQIAVNYLKQMTLALNGEKEAEKNYDWMMLELYDQAVREKSGGEMLKYLSQDNLSNENFIYQRIGDEGKALRKMLLAGKNGINENRKLSIGKKIKRIFKPFFWKNKIQGKENTYFETGKFRNEGEIHQWMYDRFSLKRLLMQAGFKNVQVKTAFESNIKDWNRFELEAEGGQVRKPDSLFMEGIKQ